jgi:cytochrome c peroxidase
MGKPHLLLIFLCCISGFLYAQADRSHEPIKPIPLAASTEDKARVELGKRLFSDPRLSGNDSISCASCHDLGRGGVDSRVRSIGIYGEIGDVNAPTVYNAGFNSRLFWNGRAKTIEQQVDDQIQNPREMGADWKDVVTKFKGDPAFPNGPTAESIKGALAAFVKSLTTPNARFDKWLKGDENALSEKEIRGYEKFKESACISCHDGINVGGSKFKPIGDIMFRVPSIRNVAVTAPYYHDGSVATLDKAVVKMGKQTKQKLSSDDVKDIVAFLKSLTGEFPK